MQSNRLRVLMEVAIFAVISLILDLFIPSTWALNISFKMLPVVIIALRRGTIPGVLSGFLWGFLFSIIGLIVVLLEKDKEEHDRQMANSNGLSMAQWLLIFLGIGILLILIFFIIMNLM